MNIEIVIANKETAIKPYKSAGRQVYGQKKNFCSILWSSDDERDRHG